MLCKGVSITTRMYIKPYQAKDIACLILTVAFLGTSFVSLGQNEHIQFKNEFEKRVLTDIESHSELEVLLAISENGSNTLVEKVNFQIEKLKSDLSKKKFDAKPADKKLKLLFDLTHKNFFLKYKEISNFDKIFDTKEYNCVSATALYCLVLQEYDIPFSIKETPTHVYSIAYPATRSIVLESTAPKNGYYNPSNSDIQKAVGSLVELKYYTKEEVESKGVRQVYNEFFYSEDEIDIKKLAGLQYHNEAITYLSEEDYERALNSNYKSQILYRSEKTEYLGYILLAGILNKSGFETFADIQYLAQYANISIVDKDEITSAYKTIMNDRLFHESDVANMDSIYSYLSQNLSDSILAEDISGIHFEGYARFYAQKSDLKNSLRFSSKAYELNPNNVTIQALITQALVQDLSRRTGNTSTLKKMDNYITQFPFLEENSLYQSLYFFTYAYNAFNHFRADDIKKGLYYLKLLESLIGRFGEELRYDENQYGMVYAEAGAAYFRERRYVEAKKIIQKGLNIMPEHPELKVRLEIVLEEMN